MILDQRALREGERLSACSDMARLWWPYLASASNGYGRMAITYRVVQAYGMCDPPSEEEFFRVIQEYRRNWLLFLYIDSGTGDLWGQWYLTRLPINKTRSDEASPAPPEEEYRDWLAEYAERKRRHAQKRFGEVPETGKAVAADPAVTAVLAALQQTFPSADVSMAKRLLQAARAASPEATAEQIIQAMKQTYKRQQESPGLFLTTVPAALPAILRRDRQWQDHQQKLLAEPLPVESALTDDQRRLLEQSDKRRLMGLTG